MSTQNPRGPRRRIAGERRPPRPGEPTAPAAEPEQAVEAPAPRRTVRVRKADGADRAPHLRREPRAPRATGARWAPSWPVVGLLGGLAAVLVVLAVVLGTLTWSWSEVRQADRADTASRTAPAVAERAAASILSYDYRSLSADEKAAERYLSPSFEKKYASSMKLVRPNAPKLKAKVEAAVKASGVSHADPDRVNVLVYVNQTTTSTANGGEPQLALNRAMFTMVRMHGTWLVDDITSY